MIKRVKLYVNNSKQKAVEVSEKVKTSLIKYNYEVVDKGADLVIGFGGDGTLLKWLNEQKKCPKERYIGINCGTLGFMQEFEVENADDFVKNIPNYVAKRLHYITLKATFKDKILSFNSINDFCIFNAEDKTFRSKVEIDNEFLETFVGTGIIFASPTGSTARNISSVGSIMFPEIKAMQMTPIEPVLNSKIHCMPKSICIPLCKIVELTPITSDKIKIVADGIVVFEDKLSEISICLSKKHMTVLTDKKNSFVKKIREKLI